MAIMVKFNKARAQYLLQCLASGTPIQPPQGGWTGNDMLALAGACYFGAMSQGPASFRLRDIPANLNPEYQEAEEDKFLKDLFAAVEGYGYFMGLVRDEEYDEHYDSNVNALVKLDDDGQLEMQPISGVREAGGPD